ncbi:MAG TPA: autotransporter-associated beta strand repeat-containing protein [Candidatus Didemnitutus sp.]|nr:autotransporter-associated beta strand repeat-containing protein [Candidatus Didemnitutus sp.]
MRHPKNHRRTRSTFASWPGLAVVWAILGLASLTAQTTVYWDTNNGTAGAGSTPTGTWSTSNSNKNWTTNSAGTSNSLATWTNGNNAVFSAGTDAVNAYTVTVSGTVSVSGITIEEGTPTFTGGTINFSDTTPSFVVGTGLTSTINSVISGSNGFNKSGAGTVIFDSTAKTYTGTTTVSAGTLQVNASNLINSTSALSVSSGATFQLNWSVNQTVGALSGAGTVDFRTGTFTVGNASNSTFSGTLQNSYGTFVKQGTGTLTLSGNNTYSGPTTINAGAIVAASNTALGTSTSGNTIASGAALQLQGGINLTEGDFTVTGTGLGATGALRNLSGSNTLNANLTLGGNTTFQSDAGTFNSNGQINLGSNTLTVAGAGDVTFSGGITSSGGITMTGTGTTTFAGSSANSSTGALNINSGTTVFNLTPGTNATGGGAINIGDGTGAAGSAVLKLGASNQIPDYTSLLTVNSDGKLAVNGQSEKIDKIGGTGVVDLGTGGYLGVGVNSGTSTFGGTFAGTGTVEKLGSGTLTLSQGQTWSTGTIDLTGGTLSLSGINLSLGTLDVTANTTLDFTGVSKLSLANLIIASGVTLTITNWQNGLDTFYASNWNGATYDTSNAAPMNQIVFSGFSGANTHWQSFDNQITPVPEPSFYGLMLLAVVTAAVAWRRRTVARPTLVPVRTE